MKQISDIAWNVTEDIYRADSALSYSTLAKYEREGFHNLDKLFDKVETPSLLLGSMVDTYITDGEEAYYNTYTVAILPSLSDKVESIVKNLFNTYSDIYRSLDLIPKEAIFNLMDSYDYYKNIKNPETRYNKIADGGGDYYNKLFISIDKTLVSQELHDTAMAMCDALKNSEATKFYFSVNNPFEDVKRYYQLKFKATLNGINYRCMFDELIIDYKNKLIQPIDLKTSSHYEDEFFESFKQWLYNIQARLYVRILQDIISKDDYFKDFTILPYKFIVVNKKTLCPLIWDFKETFIRGLLTYGKNQQIEFRDPEVIGRELYEYLTHQPKVPKGINITSGNDIKEWLNKI